jgi:hypothetical protein
MVCIIFQSLVAIVEAKEVTSHPEIRSIENFESEKVYELRRNIKKEDFPYSGLFHMIVRLENDLGFTIHPANFPKIAINFDAKLAPVLCTNLELLKSLIKFLQIRGYGSEELLLVTYELNSSYERILVKEFPRYKIITSHSQDYFHPNWFHESPMPPAIKEGTEFRLQYPQDPDLRVKLERQSRLPACLFLGNTYWINLANAVDDYYLGINGVITGITLNASSNTQRFREDLTMGAANAVEMLAIPEFWEKRLFSLLDLSKMQIAGGPLLNSEFTRSSSYLYLSKNPVFLDYQGMKRIGEERKMTGLIDKNADNCKLFLFAKELGLGDSKKCEVIQVTKKDTD